jgi:hypothetical protein
MVLPPHHSTTPAHAKDPSRLGHPGVSIGVVVLMAVFGAADSHYYRKLAPDTPRYSGTTKKLKSAVVKSGAEGSMLDA